MPLVAQPTRFARGSVAWLAGAAWMLLVLGVYYRRVWRLAAEGFAGATLADLRSTALPTLMIAAPLIALTAGLLTWRRWRPTSGSAGWLALACAALPLLAVAAFAWPDRGLASLLPWLGEAARRAVTGAGGAALVVAAAWSLGGFVLHAIGWGPRRPRAMDGVGASSAARPSIWERALYRVSVGLGAVSYLSLGLALAGVYRPDVVVPLLAVIALGGIAWSLRASAVTWGAGGAIALALRRPLAVATSDLLWAGVSALALCLALAGALAPEIEYDALWYHLWLPRVWLEHGRPVDVLTEFVSLYPLTWELLYGDALALGGAVAAKLLHFTCLPLIALATWQLVHRFFRPVSPWLAVAIVVTVPVIFWEATTAYIDLALALYVTLGLYALLRHLEEQDAAWLRLSALSFALAVAVKHLGLVVLAIVCIWLAVRAVLRPSGRWRALRLPIVLGLSALVLAAPWYWRAWAASGNPFFPEFYGFFGARPPERWNAITERGLDAFKARFGFPRTAVTLALLPWNVTQHAAAFVGCPGPLFLVALPWMIAAGLGLSRRPRRWWRWPATTRPREDRHAPMLLFLVVAYVAAWASPVSSFQLRFLVPIAPPLSVLCALGLTHCLAPRPAWARRAGHAALGLVMVLNLPPFIPLHEGDRESRGPLAHVTRIVPLPVVIGRQSEDEYLRREVGTYGAWRYLAASASPAALVLDAAGGDNFYATRNRVPVDAPPALGAWAEGAGAEATILATFARLHVTHVLFDRDSLRRMAGKGAVLASEAFREDWLRLEYEDERAVVYRVLPARSSTMQRSFLPSCLNASKGW